MRHQKAGLKLNRTASHRKAMFRNMVTSLFEHGQIRTTDAKAKEIRRWAEKMITLAKRGDLHARRQAMSVIRSKQIVHKLFEEAEERFGKSQGGYTRIIKIGRRRGDAAPISLVELLGGTETEDGEKRSWFGFGQKKAPAEKEAAAPEAADAAPEPEEAPAEEAAPEVEEAPAEEAPTEEAAAPEADEAPAEEDKKSE